MASRGKGQVSMEYLAIFAIAAMMTLPLIAIFVIQTGNVQSDITNTQIQKAASEIVDSAKEVYYMGSPAQKTLSLDFPSGVQEVTLNNSTIIFTVQGPATTYDLIKDAPFNMSGEIKTHSGLHIITIKAYNGFVNISDR